MPTAPVDQGCAAIQRSTSSASCCSSGRYSSWSRPSDSPAAAQVHPQRGVPVPREVDVARPVARRRAVPLAVGDVLEDRRDRVAPRRPRGARCGRPAGCRRPSGSTRGRSCAPGAGGRSPRASADRRSEQLVRVLAEPGRGPAAPARRPSTLKTLPSRRTGPTPGCSTDCTSPLARTCSSSNSWSSRRTSPAGTRRAASAATASATPRRAKPSSTARTCAARRSRSAASAGLGLGVVRRTGPSRPSSSHTCRRCSALRQASAMNPSAQACAR